MRLPRLCQWVSAPGYAQGGRKALRECGLPGTIRSVAGLPQYKPCYIRLLFALLGYVLKGCFVNAMGMGRTLQPVHLRQSARQTGGLGGNNLSFSRRS
jgi:hypothetical protein